MSPRGLPRRAPVCWLPPREGEVPTGAIRRSCLVGKPSKISNCSRSESISFVEEWSSCLGVLHHVVSLPISKQQDLNLGRLLRAGEIGSGLLRSLRSCDKTPTAQSANNLFSCNVFSLGIYATALTKGCSGRKISPLRGRSKRTGLSKSPNGPVAGLSPENVESSV